MKRILFFIIFLTAVISVQAQYKDSPLQFSILGSGHTTWIFTDSDNISGGEFGLGTGAEFHVDYFFLPNFAFSSGINWSYTGGHTTLDKDLPMSFTSGYDMLSAGTRLTYRLQYVERNSHTLDEAIQNTAYEWASLLREMKSRASDYKVSDEFFTTMLANKNLIGATCVGLAARKAGVDNLEFDVTIVDEAGRATVPELLIPLLRTKKAILIGDHHQLPPSIAPILREDSAKKEMAFLKDTFLESSFFETLFEQLPEGCTSSLKEQFRMAPPIGDLVADLFYIRNGKRQLTNGLGDKFNSDNYVHSDCLSWFDIRGKQEKPKNSTSWHNKREADAINTYLRKLAKTSQRSISVAVITPYSAQKKMIRKLLGSKYGHQETKLGNLKIKVDTVDSFQGSEAELVCYSTVRTFGSLQFLLDKKRLNVACSRAKENLLFFGHSNYLMNWKPKEGEKNLFSEIVNKAVLCNMR